MLHLLLLDQKYITYTFNLKRYLFKFLFAREPFPIHIGNAIFQIEPRSSDLFTIYEIFSEQGYLPKLQKFPLETETVVDFGANIGVFSIWASLAFNPKLVIATEMEPLCYQRLVENIALNHLEETVRPFQAAIFSRSGTVGMRKVPGSNFYEVSPQNGNQRVRSFSFEDFLNYNCLERIELLKIDIEGAEKYLLTEENASLFQERVGYMMLETHSLNDFRTEHALSYLRGLGFHLKKTRTPYILDRNYIIDACNPALPMPIASPILRTTHNQGP
jgi:FkbM family methyltransferase